MIYNFSLTGNYIRCTRSLEQERQYGSNITCSETMLCPTRSAVCILIGAALVFQILPVISVPVVQSIALCTYNGNRFGVFGWCKVETKSCTAFRIGYVLDSDDYSVIRNFLPSSARMSVSKLLIVHPISLLFTFILWCLTLVIGFHRLGNSRKMLIGTVLWSLPTILLSLLSFLVDILLFVPQLAWPGWLVLVGTIMTAVASSMICIMRRAASLKKYERLRNRTTLEMYPLHFSKNSKTQAAKDGGRTRIFGTSSSQLSVPEVTYRF